MGKKTFDQNKFEELFDGLTSDDIISSTEIKAYEIMNTIVDYIDCLGSFINSIELDEVYEAMSMLSNENIHKVHSLNRSESAISIIKDIRNEKKATSADLF